MLAASIPYKFATPWASGAAGGYITAAIPSSTASPGASQTLGFPPATATPVGAGGTPPAIADFNGAFSYATLWARWQQAGAPVVYDGTFATAIGGYPLGARLPAVTITGAFWVSTADDNLTDPDAGGAGWTFIRPPAWDQTVWTDTGAANGIVITLAPAPTSLAQITGVKLSVRVVAANTGATTITINGLAALAVRNPNGAAANPSQLIGSGISTLIYDGSVAQLIGPATPPQFSQVQVTATGAYSGTAPVWATRLEYWVTGAGGGGGGGDATYAGAGAGAGGTALGSVAITGGAAYSGTIGVAGLCANVAFNGTDGTASNLVIGGITYQGNGGQGGVHGVAPGGGQGGTASGTGALLVSGGSGLDGAPNAPTWGGGGGASFWGGGGRAATTNGGGQNGAAFGSGAGGAYSAGGSSALGGTGANGVVLLKFYSS